jgi:predicted membrane chloride channel (bestrophin family)
MDSYRRSARSLWAVLFHVGEGNVLFAVLPFCIINCLLLGLVDFGTKRGAFSGFSPTGHGLLTLLVSFLVISKVNLAYDRYWRVRTHAGDAYRELRELVQMVIAVSTSYRAEDEEVNMLLHQWRTEAVSQVKELMDAMQRVLQNPSLAGHFARNDRIVDWDPTNDAASAGNDDPMASVHTLRMHLYCSSDVEDIQLLERISLCNKLQEFIASYNKLLIFASTPLPFPLVQMGRAFLFVWTFSMPLVLLEGPFSQVWTAQVFLFFLTYGFIGLELVSLKLADPFGDGRDDVQLGNIQDATIAGIEHDLRDITGDSPNQRRLRFSQHKEQQRQRRSGGVAGQNQQNTYVKEMYFSMHDDAVVPPRSPRTWITRSG